MRSTIATSFLLASLVYARDIPANLQAFYDANLNAACVDPISDAFTSGQADADTVYCKDDASGAVFLKDSKNGGFADMDIDCDGLNADQGDCHNDPTGQSITAFQDEVSQFGIKDLDAHIHTYVVFGNEGDNPSFSPTDAADIQHLSVVAVLCNNQLLYGVWGDTNGATSVGESSLALGQLCFPDEEINGDSGHTEHDVLYIAFPGEDAVPGAKANWKASTREAFEQSLQETGDALVQKIGSGNAKSRIMRGKL
ncbi:chitosanase [Lophiotrema nucula]|uniref:Endo-chitosanase n=1 Tax=Lophiotrema nucula TaxID=690887 RepID=A0A6A5ZW52_9PLEO|nr:chitosanase [Lophiotrema nucula]